MISVNIQPGKYIVAVSGGVDSVVLLDVLQRQQGLELIVAHFDHGIRPDSAEDKELVQGISTSYNIPFESAQGRLGPKSSEEKARTARYNFLRHACKKYNASGIITAHHRDDLLETAVINLLRGTGWRGLSSLRSTNTLLRPLLNVSKAELLAYAQRQHLVWHEDSTNQDQHYLRNYVRHTILRRASAKQLAKLQNIIVRQSKLTDDLDDEAAKWIQTHALVTGATATLPRYDLIMMPEHVAHEIIQQVLRRVSGKSQPRPVVKSVLLFSKVAKSHRVFQLDSQWQLRAGGADMIVEPAPSMVSLDNAGGPYQDRI